MSEQEQDPGRRDSALCGIDEKPSAKLDEKLLDLVGIGASAGGLEALQTLFDHVPDDTGAAFVVIQHLSPDFKSMMDKLIEKHTRMPITVVEHKAIVEPNHIYIMSPGRTLTLEGLNLFSTERSLENRFGHPINDFFLSMAQNDRINSIGVILSGTGSDGTLGVKSIFESGGLILVQNPDEAQFDGMPVNAIATGVVDLVANVQALASSLTSYLKDTGNLHNPFQDQLEPHREDLTEIFELLKNSTGINFSYYKITTIARRLEHRMGLSQFNRISDYIDFLKNPQEEELEQLKQVLLIGVTKFFRDQDACMQLAETVIDPLLLSKNAMDPMRVWSVGCSTGEEAYTIAIMIHEAMTRLKIKRTIKIFATDVSSRSINIAMAGLYTESICSEVPEQYIKKHFSVDSVGLYRIREHIRNMVVFACHDVLRDPPFSNIDLVTCRNMLIYFKPDGQQKAFNSLDFSLAKGGCLFLGKAETPTHEFKHFACLDYPSKIYQKTHSTRRRLELSDSRTSLDKHIKKNNRQIVESMQTRDGVTDKLTISDINSRNILLLHITDQLLDDQLPPTIILTQELEVIKSYGNLTPWLKAYRPGEYHVHARDIFLVDVANHLVSAVRRAIDDRTKINFKHVESTTALGSMYTLSVTPFSHHTKNTTVFIVNFIWETNQPDQQEQRKPAQLGVNVPIDNIRNERLQALEQELQETREKLRLSQMELETISAQLQTSNEELMASNEELQGTNEELQSVNEELYTLNSEYQQKINELTVANSDLDNFMKSTGIAAIFLDRAYRIRRYTQPFSKYINILPVDINRSFLDLKMAFDFQGIEDYLERTARTGQPTGGKLEIKDNAIALYKIMPYLDASRQVDGIVIIINEEIELNKVLLDMQTIKEAQDAVYKYNKIAGWTYNIDAQIFTFRSRHHMFNVNSVSKKVFYQLITGKKRETFIERMEQTILTGEDFSLEHDIIAADDSTQQVFSMVLTMTVSSPSYLACYRIAPIIMHCWKASTTSNNASTGWFRLCPFLF